MDNGKKKILHVFDDYVFGSMRRDVDCAIRADALNLATLGLVTYIEFLGGLATGKLGIAGTSRENFEAFLSYMGSDYQALAGPNSNVYERLRCGLVHQYFHQGRVTRSAWCSVPYVPRLYHLLEHRAIQDQACDRI